MTTVTDVITRHREQILLGWTTEAKTLPAARGLSASELTNKIARYLTALGTWDDPHGERRRQLTNHLSARLREGYGLSEVLEDLAILGRHVVLASSAEGDAIDDAEQARLHGVLREDATVVIEAVTQYLMNDVQQEKQYLRRLQEVANDALLSAQLGAALKDRLGEVLDLVMEAVGAQTAAILFHDREQQTLWVADSAGLVKEPLMHYVTNEPSASFVAQIALQNDQTTSLLDVETTELDVSDPLRQSGIHSLLGVRLPARHTLVGVMYIGLTERRPFTLREVQRLETLGAQLSRHLDESRINAELKARVEELRVLQVLREHFISVLAHDLRNPLSVIRSVAQLLTQHVDQLGEHRDLPGRALRNVLRADAMIRDLLDVLRIQAGHGLPLVLEECDLAAIARGACAELASVYGDRFVVHAGSPVRGTWSADALHRALWNLGANAVKYGDATAPIDVTVRGLDTGAELAVHNQGSVIAVEDRGRLFKPFAQLPGDTEGEHPGWGLGLAYVQSCVQAHGGSVEVASAPELGTTFTLKLPTDARPFQTAPAPKPDPSPAVTSPRRA